MGLCIGKTRTTLALDLVCWWPKLNFLCHLQPSLFFVASCSNTNQREDASTNGTGPAFSAIPLPYYPIAPVADARTSMPPLASKASLPSFLPSLPFRLLLWSQVRGCLHNQLWPQFLFPPTPFYKQNHLFLCLQEHRWTYLRVSLPWNCPQSNPLRCGYRFVILADFLPISESNCQGDCCDFSVTLKKIQPIHPASFHSLNLQSLSGGILKCYVHRSPLGEESWTTTSL